MLNYGLHSLNTTAATPPSHFRIRSKLVQQARLDISLHDDDSVITLKCHHNQGSSLVDGEMKGTGLRKAPPDAS